MLIAMPCIRDSLVAVSVVGDGEGETELLCDTAFKCFFHT